MFFVREIGDGSLYIIFIWSLLIFIIYEKGGSRDEGNRVFIVLNILW